MFGAARTAEDTEEESNPENGGDDDDDGVEIVDNRGGGCCLKFCAFMDKYPITFVVSAALIGKSVFEHGILYMYVHKKHDTQDV